MPTKPLTARDYERELEQEPYGRHLFQVLRRLECLYGPQHPRIGESVLPRQDRLRLRQRATMQFPPSMIESVRCSQDGSPTEVSIYSFGLFGPNGPLPLHLTEYARQEAREGDDSFEAFADIFHHRLISLFYRAWAMAQPTVQYDRPSQNDRYAVYVGALAGLAVERTESEPVLPPEARLFYAGRLAAPPRNPDGLRAMLSQYFEVPVQIQEFVGHWVDLPLQYQSRLGESRETGELGRSLVMGGTIWQVQDRFRIVIGPLEEQDYQRFLPPSETVQRLAELVRAYVGEEYSWEVRLILSRKYIQPLELGGGRARLGLSSWMHSAPLESDPGDYVMEPGQTT